MMNVVDFEGAFGQTVRISIPSGPLSLAEVQVEGLVHTPSPTISAAPSISPAPTMTYVPFAKVDFSDRDSSSNTPFDLKNGAEIIPNAPGGFPALRISRDGPYATIPGVNINPGAMPDCTLTIGLYLESIANNRGWVFGHEQSGYDRTILMHDSRFGGGIASAVGRTWNPWNNPQAPPVKEWIYVTAVFRQNGESVVYLNGVKSDKSTIGRNNSGKGALAVGRPEPWGGHWVDAWIKEVNVFDTALDDQAVEQLVNVFLKKVSS